MDKNAQVLELGKVSSYPSQLLEVIKKEIDVFRAWELDFPSRSASSYDRSMERLCEALQPYAVRGWHCTKLTRSEIEDVRVNGLRVLNYKFLEARIGSLVKESIVDVNLARLLLSGSRARDSNRAGMAWFCFYEPRFAGEEGIRRLLSNWGGEALYWAFEGHSEVGPILRNIGIPAVVEARVPINVLRSADRIAVAAVRVYLKAMGERVLESAKAEHYSIFDIPASFLEAIHVYPESGFRAITSCDGWRLPLSA